MWMTMKKIYKQLVTLNQIRSLPIQNVGRNIPKKWYCVRTNHINTNPIKLIPINFESASPSTRLSAYKTIPRF